MTRPFADVEPTVAALIDGAQFIDIRLRASYDINHIVDAIHLELPDLAAFSKLCDVDTPLVVYCNHGVSSLAVCAELVSLGFNNVMSLRGGFEAWTTSGLPTSSGSPASNPRYARQVVLPQIGLSGQQKLFDSRVLVAGVGGLGSPAAMFLAAAGVGTIGLADHDTVAISNLHRQILHSVNTVGASKVDSAKSSLAALNPDITLATFDGLITSSNAAALVTDFDIVVDATDNFETRLELNEQCQSLNKPMVHGSVHRFEGRVSVFVPNNGPCYRCTFADLPDRSISPSCDETGVLGATTGIVGTMQAMETIKLLLKIGSPLVGQMLVYDTLNSEMFKYPIPRRPDCPTCA